MQQKPRSQYCKRKRDNKQRTLTLEDVGGGSDTLLSLFNSIKHLRRVTYCLSLTTLKSFSEKGCAGDRLSQG